MTSCSFKAFPNKARNLFLLPLWNFSARQGPRTGQVFSCRTLTHIPALAFLTSFMEIPGSLHPLLSRTAQSNLSKAVQWTVSIQAKDF